MSRYYHCTLPQHVGSILRSGIMPGKDTGIDNGSHDMPSDNRYVYLLKNLTFLKGEYYKSSISNGAVFLSVDIPHGHPIERDYDIKTMFRGHPESILWIFEMLQVSHHVEKFVKDADIIMYAATLKNMTKKQQIEKINEKIIIDISSNGDAMDYILNQASDEKWDEILACYRSPEAIPPDGKYKIEVFS